LGGGIFFAFSFTRVTPGSKVLSYNISAKHLTL
jgi:hypothetical protein